MTDDDAKKLYPARLEVAEAVHPDRAAAEVSASIDTSGLTSFRIEGRGGNPRLCRLPDGDMAMAANRPRLHPPLRSGNGCRPDAAAALHGSGGDEHDLLPLAERIAPGHALVSPRGKVNEQGITRFFRRAPDGAWDIDDLASIAPTSSPTSCAARAAPMGCRSPSCSAIPTAPTSAGRCCCKEPGALAGAILLRAMLPFDPRPLPDLSGIPVLLIAGP